MNRFIILDANCRKGFDTTSILRHQFPEIPQIIGFRKLNCFEKVYSHLIFRAKPRLIRTTEYDQFKTDLIKLSVDFANDTLIFIPLEEKSTFLFLQFCKENGSLNFKYLLPDLSIFELVRDKYNLNKFCNTNNIPAPKLFESTEIDSLSKESFPVLLKPRIGSGSVGIYRLYNPDDYNETIRNFVTDNPYLVQELLPNGSDVIGAFFLYENGCLINAYTHHRIRTSPPQGGVTVLSEIVLNPEVIKSGKKLLDKLKWNGLIMLEFLYDPKEKSYKIIEANPRLWGSVMLSEYSGCNLLKNYVNICLCKDIEEVSPKKVRIRWFFPVDVLAYIKSGFQIPDFWSFRNTCFINWTYSNKVRAVLYNLTSLFKVQNIKRFFRK